MELLADPLCGSMGFPLADARNEQANDHLADLTSGNGARSPVRRYQGRLSPHSDHKAHPDHPVAPETYTSPVGVAVQHLLTETIPDESTPLQMLRPFCSLLDTF
jgi:hypothetical protein